MSEELKPCPFCGCPFAGISWPIVQSVRLSVKCPSCHSHGGYGNTEAEAAEAWNTRAPTDRMKELCEALEQWKCPACGGRGYYINRYHSEDTDGIVSEELVCTKCEGFGLHPTAKAALENAKGGGR